MGTRSSGKFHALAAVLVVTSIAALGGCYTVLKHPPTAEVADGGERRRDCFDCHQDQGFAQAIDPLYVPEFDYYNDNYYPYYAYPWWYRQFWYYGDSDGNGGGSVYSGNGGPRNDETRHLWGRGMSTAPAPPPVYTSPTPAAGGSGPASGTPESTPAPATGQQPGRTMKNSDKKGDEEKSGPAPKKEDSKKKGGGG